MYDKHNNSPQFAEQQKLQVVLWKVQNLQKGGYFEVYCYYYLLLLLLFNFYQLAWW